MQAKHFDKLLKSMEDVPPHALDFKEGQWRAQALSYPASFVKFSDSGEIYNRVKDICYGAIRGHGSIDCVGHWFLYANHPDTDQFLDWIVGPQYPFAFVLDAQENDKIRDKEYIKKYGFVYDNVHLPGNQLVGHMILTRNILEYPNHVKAWAQMARAGVHPTLAYLVAFSLSCHQDVPSKDDLKLEGRSFNTIAPGHYAFATEYLHKNDLAKIVEGVPATETAIDPDLFPKNGTYYDTKGRVFSVFRHTMPRQDDEKMSDFFIKELGSTKSKDDGWGGRRQSTVTCDNLVEVLWTKQKEWLGDSINARTTTALSTTVGTPTKPVVKSKVKPKTKAKAKTKVKAKVKRKVATKAKVKRRVLA